MEIYDNELLELKSKFRVGCDNWSKDKYSIVYYYPLSNCSLNCDYCYLTQSKDLNKPLVYDYHIPILDEFLIRADNYNYNVAFAIVGGEPFQTPKQFEYYKLFYKKYHKKGFFLWFTNTELDLKTFKQYSSELRKINNLNNFKFNFSYHLFNFKNNPSKLNNFLEIVQFVKNKNYLFEINVIFDDNYIQEFKDICNILKNLDLNFYLSIKNHDKALGEKYFNIFPKVKKFSCKHLYISPKNIKINNVCLTPNDYKLKIIKELSRHNKLCDNYRNCEDKLGEITLKTF